jgi:hypothetical protein
VDDPGVGLTAAGVLAVAGGDTASNRGAPARLAAFELASEPTTTPKASIPMMATAAERGEGSERALMTPVGAAAAPDLPEAPTAPAIGDPSGAAPRGSNASCPCASISPIRSAIRGDRPPHRAPHSTQ